MYKNKALNKDLFLSDDETELIFQISNFGFCSLNSINIMWSVISSSVQVFPQKRLVEFSERGSLLVKSSFKSTNYYYLSRSGLQYMQSLGKIEKNVRNINIQSINSHNILANSVTISALYLAKFKSNTLGCNRFIGQECNRRSEAETFLDAEGLGEKYIQKNSNKNRDDIGGNQSPVTIGSIGSKSSLTSLLKNKSVKENILMTALLKQVLILKHMTQGYNRSADNGIINPLKIGQSKCVTDLVFLLADITSSYISEGYYDEESDVLGGVVRGYTRSQSGRFAPKKKEEVNGHPLPSNKVVSSTKLLTDPYIKLLTDLYKITSYSLKSNSSTIVKDSNIRSFQKLLSNYLSMKQVHSEVYNSFVQDIFNLVVSTLTFTSTSSFDISRYNFDSFNEQFGIEFGMMRKYPFVADVMCSFTRNGREQEIFIEIDNRTEDNHTQVQKLLNYCWYALDNPNKDIHLFFVVNDGLVPTAKIKTYTNPSQKITNIVSRIIKSWIPNNTPKETSSDNSKHKLYLAEIFEQATNLDVYISGATEAPYDIAEVLLGSNYYYDYIENIVEFTDRINTDTAWNVKYHESTLTAELKESIFTSNKALCNTQFISDDFVQQENMEEVLLDGPLIRSKTSFDSFDASMFNFDNPIGLSRFVSKKTTKRLSRVNGYLEFNHKQTLHKRILPVIWGQEHSLDTMLRMYRLELNAVKKRNSLSTEGNLSSLLNSDSPIGQMPIVFYPRRERQLTANFVKASAGTKQEGMFDRPILVQPHYTLETNPILRDEVREVLNNNIGAIIKYLLEGYLRKNNILAYSDFVLPPLFSFEQEPRSQSQLKEQLSKVSRQTRNRKKDIIANNLLLREIPLAVFIELYKNAPQTLFNSTLQDYPLDLQVEKRKNEYLLKIDTTIRSYLKVYSQADDYWDQVISNNTTSIKARYHPFKKIN